MLPAKEGTMYRIGEFSRLSRIPVKTLRYYDAIGLLCPARVDRSTGYRSYAAAQLERLNRILVFKDLGFSLREIRALVAENVPLDQVRELLRLKHDALERNVRRERARLARAAARLDLIERCGQAGAHEVAVRGTAPQLVASLRATLASHDECERLFEELERRTGGPGRRRQRGAIWHACAEGSVDCEAFVFLRSPVGCDGAVRVRELPAQRVASLVYRGDEDYLAAYRAMRAWIAAGGARVVGPKRELFLEESGPEAESVTEIQFPIAADADDLR
jgi:DNA-binding transcriptional MerR regulator